VPLAAAATCVVAVQAAQRALAQVTFQVDRVYSSGQFFNEYVKFLRTAEDYLPPAPAGDAPVPADFEELGVHGVTLCYPERERPAVDDLSLTLRAGQTIALVGENGSGKTTLAAMIAGLREPTAGHLTFNGRPYAGWDPACAGGSRWCSRSTTNGRSARPPTLPWATSTRPPIRPASPRRRRSRPPTR
jgi:ATP-binding cassette subfamily B protein